MALFSSKDSQENGDEAAYQSRAEEESRATRTRKPRKARSNGNDDALLPEKKRARRRLVGAIALVVAVVIGLPMVLDSEPKPLAEDIAIQIPSKDKVQPVPAAAPVPIVGDAPAAAAPAAAAPAAAAALDQKEEIVEAPKAPADKLAVKAVDTTKPEAKPEPKAEAKVEPKPAAVTEAKPAAKEPAKDVHKEAAKPEPAKAAPAVDDAARAKALLEGKPDPKAAKPDAKPEAKSEKLVLQVAAFGTQDKVNEVQAKLKGAGIMSYTQKVTVGGSEKIRIRVLAQNKAEADRLQAKMKALGFTPNVVQP